MQSNSPSGTTRAPDAPMLDPHQRLESLQQKLARSVDELQAGQIPNLDGVDREVERLCHQVLMLSQEEGLPFLSALQALSDDFTALGTAMESMKGAIHTELGELQARAKAHKAYGMRGTVKVAGANEEIPYADASDEDAGS